LYYAQAEAMINEVRDAFKANLKNLTWMDKETRDAAESKADAITDMIGEFLYRLEVQDNIFNKILTYILILYSRIKMFVNFAHVSMPVFTADFTAHL
jgi:predicted metalloendopeptidase